MLTSNHFPKQICEDLVKMDHSTRADNLPRILPRLKHNPCLNKNIVKMHVATRVYKLRIMKICKTPVWIIQEFVSIGRHFKPVNQMSSNMIIISQNIRFPFENYRIHCNAGDRLISMCINYHFHVNSEQNQKWGRAKHYTLARWVQTRGSVALFDVVSTFLLFWF